jgi:hypothetical protein
VGATVSPPTIGWTPDDGSVTDAPRAVSAAISVKTWNDLDIALGAALSKMGWAVLRVRDVTPTDREYDLVSVRDEPGLLSAALPDNWLPQGAKAKEREPWDAAPVGLMRLTARLTRFGEAEAEAELLREIRRWRAPVRAR